MRYFQILLILFIFCLGCTIGDPKYVSKSYRVGEEDHIREAVFKYMMSGGSKVKEITSQTSQYCVSIKGEDPSQDFMNRFANRLPPLLLSSECSVSEDDLVVARTSGERAVQLEVSEINWKGNSKDMVRASGGGSVLSGASYDFQVNKINDVWKVSSTKRRVVF